MCAVNEQASCCRTPLRCLLPVCGATAGLSGVFVALLQQYNVRMILPVASKIANLCVFTVNVRKVECNESHSRRRETQRIETQDETVNWETN